VKLEKLIDIKAPRFRRGGAAALVTALVIAAAVFANLIVAKIPLKADLSDKKLFSLSDRSLSLISALTEETSIYACFKQGSAPTEIAEGLQRYADASPKLSLRWVDLEKDPGFAKRYAGGDGDLSTGAVVVVGSKSGRWKAIPYVSLYELGYDQNTGQQTVQGVRLEQEVTGALSYVASGKTDKLYELSGHGEFTLASYGLEQELSKQNKVIQDLSLISSPEVPSDASLLVALSPKTDLSEGEADSLRHYLDRGGKLAVFLDPGAPLPKLEEVLRTYGVKRETGLVMEGRESSRLAGNPFFLLPSLANHAITKPLEDSRLAVTYPAAAALSEAPLHRRDAKLSPVLTTTAQSWLRVDGSDATAVKKSGEKGGPFTLAYAVEVPGDDGKPKNRLVVAGSSFFISPRNPAIAPGNRDLFLNMISWSIGDDKSISIGPKYFFSLPFQANGLVTLILMALFVVLLPGGLLVGGLVVWLRRRNR